MVKEVLIQSIDPLIQPPSVDDSIKECQKFWSGLSPSSRFMDRKCPDEGF